MRGAPRVFLGLFLCLVTVQLYAARKSDLPSSKNGVGPFSTCPDSQSTPFFVVLDGTETPPSGCANAADPNQPNPPATYPNRVVTLTDTANSFTVTITPALWDRGDGQIPVAESKATILEVEFSGQAGMTLQSLVIGTVLDDPTYVICDPNFANAVAAGFCTSAPLLNPTTSAVALEPTPIAYADMANTRWDFSQFSSGGSVAVTVDGFPSEFATIDNAPNSNLLAPQSFAASNFLAIVKDSSGQILTAGGLTLSAAPEASNDAFANATLITSPVFSDFVNASAANPSENPTDGTEVTAQSDPLPTDPSGSTFCLASWPANSNRVFRSVWYKFTAAGSGQVTISTQGSRYDTGVYVFTGSEASPAAVACNDDAADITIPTSQPVQPLSLQSSQVTFTTSAGPYNVMVSEVPPEIGTDDQNNPAAIPLANDATLRFNLSTPGLTVSPAALSFSSLTVGTSATLPITVTAAGGNVGGINVTTTAGSDFAVDSGATTCGASLTAPNTCMVSVGFAPTDLGSRTGTLTIANGGVLGPVSVQLSGTGTGDFQISGTALSPSSVAAGSSATSTITLTPTPSTGLGADVMLSCSITPAMAHPPTCAFSPTTVTNGSGTSTLTVRTVGPSALLAPALRRSRSALIYALLFPVGGIVGLGLGFALSSRRRRMQVTLAAVALAALLFLWACGGGSSSGSGGGGSAATPTGQYTVTVTGTSGSLTHSTSLTLTVQ